MHISRKGINQLDHGIRAHRHVVWQDTVQSGSTTFSAHSQHAFHHSLGGDVVNGELVGARGPRALLICAVVTEGEGRDHTEITQPRQPRRGKWSLVRQKRFYSKNNTSPIFRFLI